MNKIYYKSESGQRFIKQKKKQGVKGSLAIEMALILPIILLIVFVFYSYINEINHSIYARHALDQVAKEIELIYPLSDIFTDTASLDPDERAKIDNMIDLPDDLTDFISDISSSLLAAPFINKRYSYWIEDICSRQNKKVPQVARRYFVDYAADKNCMYLNMSYDRSSLLSKGQEELRAIIPLWNASLEQGDDTSDDSEEDDNIWLASNFERGLRFRQIFSANLPATYPCIARWHNKTATSIKSMDLTAPSWQSENNVEKRVFSFVDKLKDFEGSTKFAGVGPAPGEIENKELILVLPRNSPDWLNSSTKASWQAYARSQGVELKINYYGYSKRYEDES